MKRRMPMNNDDRKKANRKSKHAREDEKKASAVAAAVAAANANDNVMSPATTSSSLNDGEISILGKPKTKSMKKVASPGISGVKNNDDRKTANRKSKLAREDEKKVSAVEADAAVANHIDSVLSHATTSSITMMVRYQFLATQRLVPRRRPLRRISLALIFGAP